MKLTLTKYNFVFNKHRISGFVKNGQTYKMSHVAQLICILNSVLEKT